MLCSSLAPCGWCRFHPPLLPSLPSSGRYSLFLGGAVFFLSPPPSSGWRCFSSSTMGVVQCVVLKSGH